MPDHPAGVTGTEQDVMGARVAAALVDNVVGFVFLFVVLLAVGRPGVGDGTVTVSLVVAAFGYYAVPEARWGQTPGKRAMGLVVTDEYGGRVATGQVVARNLLRVVDGLFYWLVGLVAMLVSERNQRVGDRVAGTVVLATEHRRTGREPDPSRRADRRRGRGRRHR